MLIRSAIIQNANKSSVGQTSHPNAPTSSVVTEYGQNEILLQWMGEEEENYQYPEAPTSSNINNIETNQATISWE